MIDLKRIKISDVLELQKISIETFNDTFGEYNSLEDLNEMFENNYNSEQLKSEINNQSTDFEFIYVDGQIAGYLKINWGSAQSEDMGNSFLEVERIYIRKAFKRQGLGTKLMDYAIEKAKKLGKQYIWLGVWENNSNAIGFYQSKKFIPFSDYIFMVGEDKQRDILMKKKI